MQRLTILTLLGILPLLGDYKTASAGAPPAEASAVAAALASEGIQVLKDDGSVLCELWLAKQEPAGGSPEQNATWSSVPQGALLGLARFPARHADRRGQTIQPGLYTLRYGLFPMNGDHQGIEPQRDFLILSPLAADTDPAAKPGFDQLMNLSRKASRTPHPLVLSFWKEDAPLPDGIELVNDHDQVLHAKIGATQLSIILVGKNEH
jgi:hypothetical protein